MATEDKIIRSKAEEDLTSIVKETAPKTPVAVVLQSSAWHNKSNHNRSCTGPELVAVQKLWEDQQRVQSLVKEEATPLHDLANEKVAEEEVEQQKVVEQQTAPLGKGGKDSYLSAETFQAGCTCGADITVGGHDPMTHGDVVSGNNEYDTNMSDDSKDTSYLTHTEQSSGMQDTMQSGSMMGYDGQKKKGSGYLP